MRSCVCVCVFVFVCSCVFRLHKSSTAYNARSAAQQPRGLRCNVWHVAWQSLGQKPKLRGRGIRHVVLLVNTVPAMEDVLLRLTPAPQMLSETGTVSSLDFFLCFCFFAIVGSHAPEKRPPRRQRSVRYLHSSRANAVRDWHC